MSLPALILAAGASRRLGRPKQLEPVDGEALLRRTARVALEAGCVPVFVVLGAARERITPCLEDLPVEVLVNEAWETGQELKSLVAADAELMSKVTPADLDRVFDVTVHFRDVNRTFKAVGL